jgi:hypothetical protein
MKDKDELTDAIMVSMFMVIAFCIATFVLFTIKYRRLMNKYSELSSRVYQLEVREKLTTERQYIEPSEVEISVNGEE